MTCWQCRFPAPLPQPGGVVAVGTFDGVHAGHQFLLRHARQVAQAHGLPLVALTFDPHPRQVLFPTQPLRLLQTLPERVASLAAAEVNGVALVPFTPRRAHQSPAAFIQEILDEWLQARHVVVGENFRFGHRAAGTPALLAAHAHFQTHILSLVGDETGPYSSSRLRQTLPE